MLGPSKVSRILDREFVGSRHRVTVFLGLAAPLSANAPTRVEESGTAARSPVQLRGPRVVSVVVGVCEIAVNVGSRFVNRSRRVP